jgi:hypothetical protein
MQAYGHTLRILVDAKFYSGKIDVKDVEEVLALAEAVKANQVVNVAANDWTEPAAKKAEFEGCSLRLFTLEEALDTLVTDKWEMCPNCKNDCIVLDMECRHGFIWCQDCGQKEELPFQEDVICGCGFAWRQNDEGLTIRFDAESEDDDNEEEPPAPSDPNQLTLF